MIWNRADRYILSLFWTFFLGSLAAFVILFLAIDAMNTLVQYPGVTMNSVLRFYLMSLPEKIHQLLPIAALIGSLFTISTLSKTHELTALMSLGMSLWRVILWVIISLLGLCALSLFMSDRVLPRVTIQKNFIYFNEIKKNPSLFSMVKNERIWYRTQNHIFNIKTLNDRESTAQGLTLYSFNEGWDLIQMITADTVAFKGANWDLGQGSITVFGTDSSFPLTSDFKLKSIVMGEDSKDLAQTGSTSDTLTHQELREFIKRNKAAGLDTNKYEVDYYSKFSYSLAALVMSLLGIPFVVARSRSGGVMSQLGVCLGLVVTYWVFYSSGITLGNHGMWTPWVAAWVPNILMGGFAGGMIWLRR